MAPSPPSSKTRSALFFACSLSCALSLIGEEALRLPLFRFDLYRQQYCSWEPQGQSGYPCIMKASVGRICFVHCGSSCRPAPSPSVRHCLRAGVVMQHHERRMRNRAWDIVARLWMRRNFRRNIAPDYAVASGHADLDGGGVRPCSLFCMARTE